MSKKLLIITPHKSFGELLSSNLDKAEFNTVISHSVNEALDIPSIDLAIIDADIAEITLDDFHQAMLEKFPHLGTIIIHSLDQHISIKDNPENRVLLLIRPFDLAELLESFDEISRQQINSETDQPNLYQPSRTVADSCLTDAATIQDRLKESVFSPLIREALLISSDNASWSTSPPNENDARLVLETINANINTGSGNTLITYVNYSGMDNLLMAKDYPDLGTLAVLFDPAVKFTQAGKMLDEMAARVVGNFSGTEYEFMAYEKETAISLPDQALDETKIGDGTSPGWVPEVDLKPTSPDETDTFTISFPWNTGFVSNPEEPPRTVTNTQNDNPDPPKSIPVLDVVSPENEEPGVNSKESVSGASLHAGDGTLSLDVDTKRIANPWDSSPENISISIQETDKWVMVSYSFLLISNYPQFRLVDETATLLEEEIRAACQDNGWFLLFLETHQDYIQFSVRVPEVVPPALIVKHIRQRTTNKLLDGFSEFEKELIEGDFWASGQLITDGSKPEII